MRRRRREVGTRPALGAARRLLPAAENRGALSVDTRKAPGGANDQAVAGRASIALAFARCRSPHSAEEIVVSNYGVSTNGMPYAVAMAKGFFKQQGADVTGIISSDGGGTTVRNMLGGNLAYGEINPTATVIAIQQGADLKIVSDNVLTVAEFVWAVKPDSPIKTVADLKGKKIGYTNPRSTSQALAILRAGEGRAEAGATPSW